MTPATRHSEEARRSGPETERSEDPSDAAVGWQGYVVCNLRAMRGALNRSAQRTPVDGHMTYMCCSGPPGLGENGQCTCRRVVVVELTPTSPMGSYAFWERSNFASATWVPLVHCI
jgi:hypothetical protein